MRNNYKNVNFKTHNQYHEITSHSMLKWGVWIHQRDLLNLRNIPIFLEKNFTSHAPATRRHVPGTLTASVNAVRNIPLNLTDSVNAVRNIPSKLTKYSVIFSCQTPAPATAPENREIFKSWYLLRFSTKFHKIGTKMKLTTRGTNPYHFQALKSTESRRENTTNSGQACNSRSRRPKP